MVELLSGLDLSYIARYSRTLFRKCTWLKVGALISSSRANVNKSHENILNDNDGLLALQRANWNLVSNATESITAATCISYNTDTFSPIAIVMISIDMSTEEQPVGPWSDNFIDTCVRKGSMYGKIGINTHVVVQFFFTNMKSKIQLKTESDPLSLSMSDGSDDGVYDNGGAALGIIMVDAVGMGYAYNIPETHCENLAFRCVSRLMDIAVKVKPSIINKVINYTPRSKYDDCMYAMFLTSACASETALCRIMDCSTVSGQAKSNLVSCRPSSRTARPTRVIANLRFLMLLTNPMSRGIIEDLLLDEINVFDGFRKMVMDIHV